MVGSNKLRSPLWMIILWGLFVLVLLGTFFLGKTGVKHVIAQQPTGSIPTVTGTPRGPYITVYTNFSQVRIYAGPSSYAYPPVGVLLAGQQVPALGKTFDGEWILIRYEGVLNKRAWVYSPYVSVSSSSLPVVEPPPLPTPQTTPTIDPTLAAAFPVVGTSARLPTYTPPPTISVLTFEAENQSSLNRFPIGMVIFGLLFLGIFGSIISLTRGR